MMPVYVNVIDYHYQQRPQCALVGYLVVVGSITVSSWRRGGGEGVLQHAAHIEPEMLSAGVGVDPVTAHDELGIDGGLAGLGDEGRRRDVLWLSSVVRRGGGERTTKIWFPPTERAPVGFLVCVMR